MYQKYSIPRGYMYVAAVSIVLVACGKHKQDMYDVTTRQSAQMIAQIRGKQLAAKDSQDKLQQVVVQYCEQNPDQTDAQLVEQCLEKLQQWQGVSKNIIDYIDKQELNDVGYPIKNNKTHLQLQMAIDLVREQGEELISQIKRGKFYHGCSNEVDASSLPILGSPNATSFWGNENPSVSSILLASITAALGKHENLDSLPGAAQWSPFRSSTYKLPAELLDNDYPFVTKHDDKQNNMMLFGDFQFGGHRYFVPKESCQYVFGPEDASSAVGKASYLTNGQIEGINTNELIAAYKAADAGRSHDYGYQAITSLTSASGAIERIELGDIFVLAGSTAIVATKPDNKGEVAAYKYTRDIDTATTNKLSGGGVHDYNLTDIAKTKAIYVLRPSETKVKPLSETIPLNTYLEKIDNNYATLFPNGPTNQKGDARILLGNI